MSEPPLEEKTPTMAMSPSDNDQDFTCQRPVGTSKGRKKKETGAIS